MKKLLALLLALVMVAALAACSSGQPASDGGEGAEQVTEAPVSKTIADDTSVMKMSFSAPASYENVERFFEYLADGTMYEKNIHYTLADGSEITYAYANEEQDMVAAAESQEHETAEYAGKTFLIFNYDSAYQSFAQEGSEVFGVQYAPAEGDGKETFDQLMGGISFTDNTETVKDDLDLGDISFTIDNALPLFGYSTSVTETPAGDLLKKSVTWKFGEDRNNIDFRFLIRVFKNSTVEEQKKADKEYEEQEINGVTYTVLVDSGEDAPYEYMTQHGDDVYMIRNNGSNNGLWTTRSEESDAAFEAFLNTISFK